MASTARPRIKGPSQSSSFLEEWQAGWNGRSLAKATVCVIPAETTRRQPSRSHV